MAALRRSLIALLALKCFLALDDGGSSRATKHRLRNISKTGEERVLTGEPIRLGNLLLRTLGALAQSRQFCIISRALPPVFRSAGRLRFLLQAHTGPSESQSALLFQR